MKIKEVTAIILAGGKSSRMGRNKAFIKLKGKTFIEKIIATLKSIFDEVIIVTNEIEKLKGLKVRVVKDIVPNRGPLSGIHSGLVNSKTPINFVVACDMPFLNPVVINQMVRIANGYDAVVAGSNGRLETLCAVYNNKLIPLLEENLISGNYTLSAILRKSNLKVIGEKELKRFGGTRRDFLNINDNKQLRRILADKNL